MMFHVPLMESLLAKQKFHVCNHAWKIYAAFSKFVKLSMEHIDLLQSLVFFILILRSIFATFIRINFSCLM